MQVFATDPSPEKSAMALDDKRVIKMVLETAQIICTALHARGYSTPYKPTHQRHPVVLWAAESPHNISWLIYHHIALAKIYEGFSGRTHKSYISVGYIYSGMALPICEPFNFANAARRSDLNIDFTHIEDTHEAYRLYLNARWKTDIRPPVWTNRQPPKWRKP